MKSYAQIYILVYFLTNLVYNNSFAQDIEIVETKNKSKINLKLSNLNNSLQQLLEKVNRCEKRYLFNKDSVIIPLTVDELAYSLYPLQLEFLENVGKIVFVDQQYQIFTAYENRKLVYWGSVNSGKVSTPTPEGLYFVNWKHPKRISSINPSWILRYNINIELKEGIGFHQYAMPGYPASHSCIRLLVKDAKWLYEWVDLWKVAPGFVIKNKGTPIIVFGKAKDFNRRELYNIYRNKKVRDKDLLGSMFSKYKIEIIKNENDRKSIK